MTRYPYHELKLRGDETQPKLRRTRAEVDVLIKRHEVRKAAYVKEMARGHGRTLTEAEAAQQYDDQFRRW